MRPDLNFNVARRAVKFHVTHNEKIMVPTTNLEELLQFIANYPAISGFVVAGTNIVLFLAGLFVGNKQAIGRDKRKEFNEAAMPIYKKLIIQVQNLEQKKYHPDSLTEDELISFSIHVNRWSQKKYLTIIKEYEACFESRLLPLDPFNNSGSKWEKHAKDLNKLKIATKKLLPYFIPK